jgi:hypothetical protein
MKLSIAMMLVLGSSVGAPAVLAQDSPIETNGYRCGEVSCMSFDNVPTGFVCNGNGGSHGYAGTTKYLGQTTYQGCLTACSREGISGCCESRGFNNKKGKGACHFKTELKLGYSSGHVDTKAVICGPDLVSSASAAESDVTDTMMLRKV